MTHQRRKRLVTGAILLLFLAFWLYIAWCVPYTHDDWDWGLAAGMERWLNATQNNRYLGNLFIVMMTRSVAVKVLVMGVGMFLIPLLMALLVTPGEDTRRPFLPCFLAANCLMLLLPREIWKQTYGWASGFANYGVSTVFFLLWLILLRRAFVSESEEWGKALAILPVYTALLALFLENLAVIDLCLALCLLLFALVTGRGRGLALGVLLGAVIGCLLMFRNPLYNDLAASGEALAGIRTFSFSVDSDLGEILGTVWSKCVDFLLPELLEMGFSFSLLLGSVVALSLYRCAFPPLALLSVWPLVFGFYTTFFPEELSPTYLAGGVIASFLLAFLAVLFSEGPLWRRLFRLFILLAGLGTVVTMGVLDIEGGRLYFHIYVLTALVALDLALPFWRQEFGMTLCVLLLVVQTLLWGDTYRRIEQCAALRLELVRQAEANDEWTVYLPTEGADITWGHIPMGAWRAECYREFYGIDPAMRLVFLPAGSFEVWPDLTQVEVNKARTFKGTAAVVPPPVISGGGR